jgi:hypothetical protein
MMRFSPVRTWFATETVGRALTALECNAAGKPWLVWSERDRTAVAIVLGDDEQLAADGFHNMLEPVRWVGSSLGIFFLVVQDAEPFFAAPRCG